VGHKKRSLENLVNMKELLEKTYRGKSVLITGHTGFKGAWLTKIMYMLGAKITGYALSPLTGDDLFYLINGDEICNSVIGDLRDKEKLDFTLSQCQPDYIFHLAAQPLVRLSYEIPSETFEVNAVGTANLLNSVKKLDKRCDVVLITTDKVYENLEWVYPYREDDRLGGYDPYSASKACAEIVISSYRNSFFNTKEYSTHQKSIAVGRAGNVIGGGDWSKDRLLPDIARALGNNQAISVRNPKSIRPWQHVLEPLIGYMLLAVKLTSAPVEYSQAYNFGPYADDAFDVGSMVELAIKEWGSGTYEFAKQTAQPHEAGLLKLDISKAIQHIGWRPKLNAAKAVGYTVAWYKHFYESKNTIDQFTEQQIFNFLESK